MCKHARPDRPKCLNMDNWNHTLYRFFSYCHDIECIAVEGGGFGLKIQLHNSIIFVCTNGEEKFTISETNLTYFCPESMEDFCYRD